ncbi:hypothetical protein HAX54_050445, partial [Datura stramonium]|nr:hypothetical protein [Datura stramonium]
VPPRCTVTYGKSIGGMASNGIRVKDAIQDFLTWMVTKRLVEREKYLVQSS